MRADSFRSFTVRDRKEGSTRVREDFTRRALLEKQRNCARQDTFIMDNLFLLTL
jgi:hypothetical protein